MSQDVVCRDANGPQPAIYRAFRFGADGRVTATEIIEARTDDEAMGRASFLANGHGIDLWDGVRFLASYPPLCAAKGP